ncbi:hypothetical protein IW261DRAFT_532605 [Armillaria novae-zelandiae]|uniref:Uncharacterized protein n=1 Tax=Armillaria novae-zelandiae TaxID=153914 RepID=A0AA39NZR9_9AGAR|nr:hypothetical protein IW261DRAFT_532605 [Armillaria novae-zelandiae]
MSSATIPSRGQCIHPINNIQQGCRCSWFAPTLLDQYICGACGHGIHAHVDYVSMMVHHHPATQCAAYVQRSPLTQRCTCGTWLSDHDEAIDNLYLSTDPGDVLDDTPDNDNLSSSATGFQSNESINHAYTPSFMYASSTNFNTADGPGPTPARISSPFLSPYAFGHSGGAMGSIPLSSSSTYSTPSIIQSHTTQTQTQGYSSNDYLQVQYPDRLINSSYAQRQPDGCATDESCEHQHYSLNVMHGMPKPWSGQYN